MYSRIGFGPPGKAIDFSDPFNRIISVKDKPDEISTGFEFEARIRYSNNVTFPQKGGVAAFWTYWNHGTSTDVNNTNYKAHEIDYEMFYRDSYELSPPPPSPQLPRKLQLQNYRDFNASAGSSAYGNPSMTKQDTPRFVLDWRQWNTVKIKWTPKADGSWITQWYAKEPSDQDYRFLGEEGTIAPNKWMTVRFNIWNFVGYPGNTPVSDPAQNRSYFLDVDWVKVSKVASISANVTEVGGVAVSPSATTAVPNLSVVKGQLSGSSPSVNQINVVIERLSDGYKWRSYGTSGWTAPGDSFGAGTDYPTTQPGWTTNQTMPSPSQTNAGDYRIVADAFNNSVYQFSSVPVTVRVAASTNNVPVSQSFGPTGGSSNANEPRVSTASYFDEDGSDDIKECAVELRQGNLATMAYYDKLANKLYLSDGNGGRIGGFAPGSANVISNNFVSLNCVDTPVFVNPGAKQVQVRWNFTPKQPLAGNNLVNLDVTDKAGAHAGFVNKATWNVIGAPTGNSAPVAVAFSPTSGSSQVGNPYATNSIYTDANGIGDLKFLIVAIVKGSQQTRAYYDVPTNLLYLQNDAGQYVGGVRPGDNAVISNSLVTLDCLQTSVFPVMSRNEIQVRWRFVAKSGLAGVNDIYLLAFDNATASSGFQKRATWTVYAPSAAISAFSAPNASKAKTSDSPKKTYSAENPYLGEVPGGDTSKNLPKKNTSDGTEGPPPMEIPSSDSSSSSATSASASAQQTPPDPSASAS